MLMIFLVLMSSISITIAQDPNEAAISSVGGTPICAVWMELYLLGF